MRRRNRKSDGGPVDEAGTSRASSQRADDGAEPAFRYRFASTTRRFARGGVAWSRTGAAVGSYERERPDEVDELLEYPRRSPSARPPSAFRDSLRRRLLAAADVASVALAFAVSGFATPLLSSGYGVIAVALLWVLQNKMLGLYDRDAAVVDTSTTRELPKLAQSVLIGVVFIALLGPAVGLEIHRHQAVEFALTALAATAASRTLVRVAVLRWLCGPERALIVGSGHVATVITRKLKTHPRYGVEVVGRVDAAGVEGTGEGGPSLLGDPGSLRQLCDQLRIERVIIAFSSLDHEVLLDTIWVGKAIGVKVTVVPRLFEVIHRSMILDDVEGMTVLAVNGFARTRSSLVLKRAIDLIGAAIGLIVLGPVMAAIAVAIKLDSKGPVVFSQTRIGRGNKPFRIRKFRTMIMGADKLKVDLIHLNQADFPMLKIAEDMDPRLTRIGRFLRRTHLDELPQLWNVLTGQMSLVGPRPLEPSDDAEVIGRHRARLELTPGLTGPWQALGRHAIPFDEMVTLDSLYVANWTLWNDIELLIRTARLVLWPGTS